MSQHAPRGNTTHGNKQMTMDAVLFYGLLYPDEEESEENPQVWCKIHRNADDRKFIMELVMLVDGVETLIPDTARVILDLALLAMCASGFREMAVREVQVCEQVGEALVTKYRKFLCTEAYADPVGDTP